MATTYYKLLKDKRVGYESDKLSLTRFALGGVNNECGVQITLNREYVCLCKAQVLTLIHQLLRAYEEKHLDGIENDAY